MKTYLAVFLCAFFLIAAPACSGGSDGETTDTGADTQTQDDAGQDSSDVVEAAAPSVRFQPAGDGFFDVPFPSDTRLREDGSVDLSSWEAAYSKGVPRLWFDAAEGLLEGWGLVSGVFVHFNGPIDPATLPQDVGRTTDTDSGWPSVFLMDADPDSPEQGRLFPIECQYREQAGTFNDAYMLGCVSPFGITRRPNTRYAFVVTQDVTAGSGRPISRTGALESLLDGQDIQGRHGTVSAQDYQEVSQQLDEAGFDSSIAHLDLFTTGDPAGRLHRLAEYYRGLAPPEINEGSLEFVEELDDFVVLKGSYDIEVIQRGDYPFRNPPDGKIVFGEDGEPVPQFTDTIPFLITIPKTPMPAGGFKTLIFMHGSGGEAQQLVDRGPKPSPGEPAPHGSGPGGVVAPYGMAGFAAEFPLHGTRYSPPDTTGLKLYNLIGNPPATVDNFLVSANEVARHGRLLAGLEIDPSIAPNDVLDPGASSDGMLRFDRDSLTMMGQSMGSTIGLPALTVSEELDAGILSGSGGTLIEVALEATKPVDVKTLLERVLQLGDDEELDRFSPLLHALQHLWDYVDPVVHARYAVREPLAGIPAKHYLQHSGVDDGYFSVESRTALSGALGLDFVEPIEEQAALDIMSVIAPDHDTALSLPAQGNLEGGVTGVVAMYQPSVLDGHNVAYQVEAAWQQYACFAYTVAADQAPIFAAPDAALPATCGQ
ncbi:MAG: hypothetical protein ACQEVA_03875 [Myxococcota bacterium]